jgi:hypothetical protein
MDSLEIERSVPVVQMNKQKRPMVLAMVSVGHTRVIEMASAGICSVASKSQLKLDGDEFHLRLTTATRRNSPKMSGGTTTPVREAIDETMLDKETTASTMATRNKMSRAIWVVTTRQTANCHSGQGRDCPFLKLISECWAYKKKREHFGMQYQGIQ